MSGGLLALLDDVVAMTKVAAASLDDVGSQAVKVSTKASAIVIDDTAVTPRFLANVDSAQELSVVWRIAKGSLRNKLLYLLPAAMALSAVAPWAIAPLLMCGGAYLGYEAAEKIAHAIAPPQHERAREALSIDDRVRGAIQTDFILSAEIMTLTLQSVADSPSLTRVVVLALVGAIMTVFVYGVVALIVRLDDIGRALARRESGLVRKLGRALVACVPPLMQGLSVLGTAAMAWVGGGIVVHGLHELGWAWPDETVRHLRAAASWAGWFVETGLFAIVGLAIGAALLPVAALISRLRGKA